ncbi:SGNH/GDSL hydrolase family protein [Streptomyces sp. NBC_01190]|uniref:SGNH/GDSL hydrolase family protein n=1 Tax=Streptomyces sp. NBC_01190 TaxID=2903767 RepID=UPI0038685FCD|nr:SGNH/GDSL hydrolase family protein [Streptomyces sp. NBC_01190]
MTRFGLPAFRHRASVRLAVAVAASVAAAASALAPGAASASPAPSAVPAADHRPQYVALGDSYSAGVYVRPWEDHDGCGRSYRNYPHQVAEALGLRLHDVTCGAAEVVDGVLAPQPSEKIYGPPSIPPPGGWDPRPAQIGALSPATDYVTVGVGGNSLGFGAIVAKCSALGLSHFGLGSPCEHYYTEGEGHAWLAEKRRELTEDYSLMLHAIRRAAPNATVAVVGYPAIVPTSAGCNWLTFRQLGSIAKGDMPWLDALEQGLNHTLRTAALEHHDQYVDTYTSSEAHGVCAAGAAKWMYGVRDDLTGEGDQTDTPSPACEEIPGTGEACTFVHPNASGLDNQARQVIAALS